jgi:hypothetical protein
VLLVELGGGPPGRSAAITGAADLAGMLLVELERGVIAARSSPACSWSSSSSAAGHQVGGDRRAELIRASSFQENWATSLRGLAGGVLPTFIPADVRYPQVATADIGRTVAAALVEGPAACKRRVIELAGPRDYTPAEVAAAAAQVTGKPVVAQVAPLDAVVPTLTSFGISRAAAGLYREMFAGVASGRVAFEGGGARQLRGTVEIAETLKALIAAAAKR